MRRRTRALVILAVVALLAIAGNSSVRSFSGPASDGVRDAPRAERDDVHGVRIFHDAGAPAIGAWSGTIRPIAG
jgi:hypothetical protein